jgi:hypothetical protein
MPHASRFKLARQACASTADHLRRTRGVEEGAAASDDALCGDEERRRGSGSVLQVSCSAI